MMNNVDIHEPTSFLDHVHLGCTQRECKPNEIIIVQYKKMFESRISAGTKKNYWDGKTLKHKQKRCPTTMLGHAQRCVERHCELGNKKVEQLYKVSSPCVDDHQFKQEELASAGELSTIRSPTVFKCLWPGTIW